MKRHAHLIRTTLTAFTFLPVLCGLLALSACGGGGSTAQQPPPASSMRVAGTLTGTSTTPQFNQQPVKVASAIVTVNGQAATTARLQPGVVILGRATRTAQGITLQSADVQSELKGPISALSLTAGTMTVLDTLVTVNALTRLEQEGADHTFTDLALADFAVGDLVSVFGTRQAAGDLLATRIEREVPGAGGESEARGVVSALDATAKTFTLGALLVSYGSATVTGTLADGIRVEVEGALSGTTLTATKVHVEDGMEGGEGGEAEVSGALSSLDATAKTFSLLSFKVDYSHAVVEGVLAEGATVEVEGAVSTTDPTLLVAVKVEVRFPKMGNGASDTEAKGPITALNATDLTLTVGGTVYWTDAQTLILDHDAPLGFAQLLVGDRVQVRALSTRTNAAGQPYAVRVERKNDGD
ncbi:MAG: hypothetical protein HXX12_08465 [Geothrix sp.]|uniref:DUF5666 domain-containing protein n=1 Tax=Geothrix sp. TaxID=1962974 RepID=UPI0017DACBFB|nr:DUF5666 domain-containing protein [Geothrix sp.]NWJ40990.1 hypothetical protein [Geothrix sp.]WIL21013.1 MAG: DUF5666 domain-containing protein [Geothrix sp.]